MAYNLSDFPISTEEPRIEVNLPVGTHILELVVEDSAGLRSLPDTVVITVEAEVIPEAAITAVEPTSAYRGRTFDLTIRGTGLAEATDVIFYTQISPTFPTRPTITLPTLSTLPISVIGRDTITSTTAAIGGRDTISSTTSVLGGRAGATTGTEDILITRPINVADSTIRTAITERAADGIIVSVNIDSSSTSGTRTIGVVTPQGTVRSTTITFNVMVLPTLTIPTLTIPTLTIPTLTIPTLTIPTLTVPTLTIPTLTIPTATLTIPTITRPTVTIPTLTVPTATLTIPTITRPTVTIPTLTIPTVTIPTLTVPHFESVTPLTSVKGVGKAIETKLKAAGITTVEELASASPKSVAEILGYSDSSRAKVLIDDAAKLV